MKLEMFFKTMNLVRTTPTKRYFKNFNYGAFFAPDSSFDFMIEIFVKVA